jgi:glycosyltransferase involved in cell wall biosynthesis
MSVLERTGGRCSTSPPCHDRNNLNETNKYVCAFRGRRDYYQVPVALAEADMLDEFITDVYSGRIARSIAGVLPQRLREKLRFRSEVGLPASLVKCLWGTTAIEHLRHRLGYPRSLTYANLDRQFSLAAAARARLTRSNLLLYNPYAWEAFTAKYSHSPRKILFQFHPHSDFERRILLEDRAKYPFIRRSFEEDAGEHVSECLKQRSRDSWKHAHLILCASTFTQESLIEAGAEASLCKVVPYGIDVTNDRIESIASNGFSALFVGTGTQRKGLHHLLLAWQKAVLPANSRLTLVCRLIDPEIAAIARQTPGVRLIRGIGNDQLRELFRMSSVFVMPSLVEGFGQVYLEALAQGCPVLGTQNTGLPDLCDSNEAIWLVEPGQIDELVAALESLSRTLPGDLNIRERAREIARRWPWAKFRNSICSALQFA